MFDVLVNRTGRKGDHVLATPGGHRYGVDHELTFHQEHNLRTILWGWNGDALSAEEIEAFAARWARLRSTGVFPAPNGDMPAVPWPLFYVSGTWPLQVECHFFAASLTGRPAHSRDPPPVTSRCAPDIQTR